MNCTPAEVAECRSVEAIHTPGGCNLAAKCKLMLVGYKLAECSIPAVESTAIV